MSTNYAVFREHVKVFFFKDTKMVYINKGLEASLVQDVLRGHPSNSHTDTVITKTGSVDTQT